MAYIAYSSEDNRVMHIGPLTRDFTGVQVRRAGILNTDVLANSVGRAATIQPLSQDTQVLIDDETMPDSKSRIDMLKC